MDGGNLDMQHHLWMVTWGGEICLSPKVEGANRVLDVGTGTGIWAMEYGEFESERNTVLDVQADMRQPTCIPKPKSVISPPFLFRAWS